MSGSERGCHGILVVMGVYLGRLLDNNHFQLIIFHHWFGGTANKFLKQQDFARGLRTAVEDRGATLVLFQGERLDPYYKLFGKEWQDSDYTRTTCFRTAIAEATIPSLPDNICIKSVHLKNVPESEQWFASTTSSICLLSTSSGA
ncbi:hypothetical protein WJX73_002369 [Symbiochloris irregularis]|uniref:Uncharacterized protein n=1 Tax=Symbiochloris irregularis TaxID=706552 RepID=A0AAW1NWA0_9CHLO